MRNVKAMPAADSLMIRKTFWKMIPLQILLVVMSNINSLVGGAVASNMIGPAGVAVVGLFMPIMKLIEALNLAMTCGAQILFGRHLGKNDLKRTDNVFSTDLISAGAIALFLTAFCLLFPDFTAKILGAEESGFMTEVKDYIFGMAPGFLALMAGAHLGTFLQLEQQEKRVYLGTVLMSITNIGLDILFVGPLKMGLFGLGLASSISCWVFFIVLVSFYFTGKSSIHFALKAYKFSDLGSIMTTGLPGAVSQFCQIFRTLALNYLITAFVGADGLSAYSAVNICGGFFVAPLLAVYAVSRILISIYAGEEDRTGLEMIVKTSLSRGILLQGAVFIVTAIFSVPLTGIFFTKDIGPVFEMTRIGLMAQSFSLNLSMILLVFMNVYQCMGRKTVSIVLSVVDGIIGTVLTTGILISAMGMNAVWFGQVFNGVITTVIIIIYTMLFHKRFLKKFEDFLVLPKNFGVPEEDRLDISVYSLEESVNLSVRVCEFCEAHGIDSRRTMLAGLFIEEMTVNVVKHGFKGKPGESVDVRVVYKDGELLLRLKDRCRAYNPKEREKMFQPDDITHNIGSRMILKIAKDMMYQHTLGMNVLSAKI